MALTIGTVFYAVSLASVCMGIVEKELTAANIDPFPRVLVPKKFDILGASHQIFHFFVVLSATVHLWGIRSYCV